MNKYRNIYSLKEQQNLYEATKDFRKKCKCGHTITILDPKGYQLCSWCRNYVFLNSKIEFEYRIKEKLLEEKRKNK